MKMYQFITSILKESAVTPGNARWLFPHFTKRWHWRAPFLRNLFSWSISGKIGFTYDLVRGIRPSHQE